MDRQSSQKTTGKVHKKRRPSDMKYTKKRENITIKAYLWTIVVNEIYNPCPNHNLQKYYDCLYVDANNIFINDMIVCQTLWYLPNFLIISH
jgi:hypothetical protein